MRFVLTLVLCLLLSISAFAMLFTGGAARNGAKHPSRLPETTVSFTLDERLARVPKKVNENRSKP